MKNNETVAMSDFEWDGICESKETATNDGSVDYYKTRLEKVHKKRNAHKREQILIDAIWYLLIAVGFGVLSIWLKVGWQVAAIVLAAAFGMTATYGFGMARILRRK